MFYWMRLAYQQEGKEGVEAHQFVNSTIALPLYHLDQWETIWDDTTDTHCVLGWSATQVVLSFRRVGAALGSCCPRPGAERGFRVARGQRLVASILPPYCTRFYATVSPPSHQTDGKLTAAGAPRPSRMR